jgi:pantoate--beta-alanine ligase
VILDGTNVRLALDTGRKMLVEAAFSRIDYFALVDAASLEPLDAPAGEMRLIAAAVIGTTRLLDNLGLSANMVSAR